MSSDRTYFRPARASDKTAVLHFTRHTWEHGDYIEMVWEDWLKDPRGKLLVATIHRRAVAVAHLARLSPTEAWLEGLRVDPEYRRSGIATSLIIYCLKNTAGMGAHILRFITSSENLAIHAISSQLGFKRTLVLQSFQALPAQNGVPLPVLATIRDLPELLEFTSRSRMLKDMDGLVGGGWQYSSLDERELESRIKANQVMIVSGDRPIQAAAVIEKRLYDNSLVICYCDGLQPALEKLLTALLRYASVNKLDSVGIRLPENCGVGAVFESAGFRAVPQESYWIFEKPVFSKTPKG